MGKIKELQEKLKQGTISEEEQKELNELLAEAKENTEENTTEETSEEEEEKAVNALADKLAESATKRLEEGLSKVLKSMEVKTPVVTHEAKFIVDSKLGKKSVDELSEIKVALPRRQDKEVKEISMKTVHFVSALMQGDVQKLQLLVEGTGSRGGFLVPDDFANMIVEDIRDQSVMRQLANVMTTTSDTLHLPNLASRPQARFRAEAAVKHTSTVDFGENVFTPYSVATIVGLTNELVADASLGVNGSIVNYVSNVMSTSLREREEKAYWIGSGSGEPTGVNAYTLRTVSAGSTTGDKVISAFMRTPQGYRNRSVWVGNASAWEAVGKLKDSNGNYLLSNLAGSPTLTLRGRPVYEQNDLPGDTLFFGDFGYYTIVDREGIEVRVSDEATVAGSSAFEKNLTFVRVEARTDGELVLPNAITKVTGL